MRAITEYLALSCCPEAGARTYAQNYKDRVLASCLADAYQNDKAGNDIGSRYSACVIGAISTWIRAPGRVI